MPDAYVICSVCKEVTPACATVSRRMDPKYGVAPPRRQARKIKATVCLHCHKDSKR